MAFFKDKIKKINNLIAIKITNFIGSMTCAYLFCLLSFYGLTGVDFHNPFQIVSWISQTFLQLVLLSIIMIGQNLMSQKTEIRAEEDHEAIMYEMQILKEMQLEHINEKEEIKIIISEIKEEIISNNSNKEMLIELLDKVNSLQKENYVD